MRSFLAAVLLTGCVFARAGAQSVPLQDTVNGALIVFEADTIDWGTVEYGSQNYRYYNFTNTGKTPFIIQQVQTSDPHYGYVEENKPYRTGEKGRIKFLYDTKRVGKTFRYLTVVSNSKKGAHRIYMKVTVLPEKK
jgi:hypothetical protein